MIDLKQASQSRLPSCTLLVWDSDASLPVGAWVNVLWKSYSCKQSEISIPKIIEEEADALKKRVLTWIYELGETRLNNKRIVDHLELADGFSYWWMMSLAEKMSHAPFSRFYDVVRLFVLENVIQCNNAHLVIFVSPDRALASIIKKLCKQIDVKFKFRGLKRPHKNISLLRYVYTFLPYPLQAAISLVKHIWQRRSLRSRVVEPTIGSVTFFDYLFWLDKTALETGKFSSQYWTRLVTHLNKKKLAVNWFHHYIPHLDVPTSKKANELIVKFNESSEGLQYHSCVDGAFSISLLYPILRDYLKLLTRGLKLRRINHYFEPKGSRLDLWPLFKRDWRKALRGSVAMENCIIINLLETSIKLLPYQKLGIYLQENQPWEVALIHIWRKYGHGKLVAVPHSTIRFWDLRYFYDDRSYWDDSKNKLLKPDIVAVNSAVVLTYYKDSGYDTNQLVLVEALRYLYMLEDRSQLKVQKNLDSSKRVLICGDSLPEMNQKILLCLKSALEDSTLNVNFLIKPHSSDMETFSLLSLQTTETPLRDLFLDCDIVVTSNLTSAAMEAYSLGLPVIQFLDGATFNMSPLRGLEKVIYVTNPEEFINALRDTQKNEQRTITPYFCLDETLPRWQGLLDITLGAIDD